MEKRQDRILFESGRHRSVPVQSAFCGRKDSYYKVLYSKILHPEGCSRKLPEHNYILFSINLNP
ncbi:hypothetical protein [Adhaeribacter aerolatus]|uniref:hypothetical protein n=1 Tax=Adhaeribacter aerolatus TaxID=670289 RepID=UPI0011BEB88A|nr:hypothetical protein [Adhaeribacter aerolatus]